MEFNSFSGDKVVFTITDKNLSKTKTNTIYLEIKDSYSLISVTPSKKLVPVAELPIVLEYFEVEEAVLEEELVQEEKAKEEEVVK